MRYLETECDLTLSLRRDLIFSDVSKLNEGLYFCVGMYVYPCYIAMDFIAEAIVNTLVLNEAYYVLNHYYAKCLKS